MRYTDEHGNWRETQGLRGLAKGHVGRVARTLALAGLSGDAPADVFRREYTTIARLLDVNQREFGITSGDLNLSAGQSVLTQPFLDVYLGESLAGQIGRVSPWRDVPAFTPVMGWDGNFAASWTPQFKDAPVLFETLRPYSLEGGRKLSGIVAITGEAVRRGGLTFEREIEAALIRCTAPTESFALIDTTADGAGAAPASLTNGLTPVALPGTPAADIKALFAEFTGDPRHAVLVTSTTNAITASGIFPAAPINIRTGGEICGVSSVFSDACEIAGGSNGHLLMLLDPSRVMMLDRGVELAAATSADLTVVDSNGGRVGLFSADTVALRIDRIIDWLAPVAGSVVFGYSTW